MATGAAASRFVRSLEARPLGLLWTAAALCAAIVGAYFLWHGLFHSTDWMFDPAAPLGVTPHNRLHLVIALLTGFLLGTLRVEKQKWPRDVGRMWALTGLPATALAELMPPPAVYRRRLRACMGVGALAGLALVAVTSTDPLFFLDSQNWNAHELWVALSNALVLALMFRVAFESFMSQRVTRQLAREIPSIDLLGSDALAPFAAMGLRHSFYWVVGTSITSLLTLDLDRAWPLIPILGFTLGIAVVAFLGPALAIRGRVREAKAAELVRVRDRIGRERDVALAGALPAGPPPASESGATALPGLLAYEARIASVREWPFDAPVLLRFAALLVFAAGSWLGGAVVERWLGALLD